MKTFLGNVFSLNIGSLEIAQESSPQMCCQLWPDSLNYHIFIL